MAYRYGRYDPKGETASLMRVCYGLSEEEAVARATDKWVYEELLSVVAVRRCEADGHDVVDHSYGTPEHGAFDMECRRCGWHFHQALY